MSPPVEQPRGVVPAQLGFLAVYNPSLGTTDETLEDQIVYYSSLDARERPQQRASSGTQEALHAAIRERKNEQLRQIGLAQGMVEFGRSFSDGRAVDTVETEKSRIILHELESGWWILASISLTILPGKTNPVASKGKAVEHRESVEYSSREVKPAILLLGDLLRAHSIFLLHHASSISALFVRTRRSKFVGILSRYWDTFLSTWSVLMDGNPATRLYGGIKVAACGELGMGVGEEERGSGEREVLEGFVGRIEGLVDVIVSKFGDAGSGSDTGTETDKKYPRQTNPTGPWLGSGNEPAAKDGVIFLGTGALSRKSLRDVSHWIEDLYRWGPYAYGVIDNPSSTRRAKSKQKQPSRKTGLSPSAKKNAKHVDGLGFRDKAPHRESSPGKDSMTTIAPTPMVDGEDKSIDPNSKKRRPSLQRGASSFESSDGESSKSNRFVQYLKLGYGTHWSIGGTSVKNDDHGSSATDARTEVVGEHPRKIQTSSERLLEKSSNPHHDSTGHYLIGLMGDIENDDGENSDVELQESNSHETVVDYNARLLLRTLTVELEREEDARAEAEISIDLGNANEKATSSKQTGSEHTGTSNTSFDSQDRNKTKKLRVVVYVNRPFIFAFLFELRTDALALTSLYRSLHYQIGPLHKPLLNSTAFRAFKPEVTVTDGSTTPIYDLIWDPKLLTVNSTIPNIPDPFLSQVQPPESLPWSRIEALNTHMQIINTYIASSTDKSELERTCKTSRGWWVVWTRVPNPEPSTTSLLASGQVNIPDLIAEDSTESQKFSRQGPTTSRGTSTFGASMNSGPAHPFLEALSSGYELIPKDKEIFLIRRASDYDAAKLSSRFSGGSLAARSEASWTSSPGKLAQGIGVDTKRYIEALLNLNR